MYINMLSDYLKNTFGEKLYRISLDGNMSCPNRDGKIDTRGCIFCSDKGSGEFSSPVINNIDLQINIGKELVSHKTKSNQFIGYFQSFTNTYAPVEYLKPLFYSVINRADIAVLSIATRPDCLGDDVLDLLKELNEIKPVWVELGLQTSNDNTAEFIRRGYKREVYIEAAKNLRAIGCKVITHLILGLPFENKQDMVESARFAGKFSDGIKFHMLFINHNTDLEALYYNNEITMLSREEYIDILCECIRNIPPNVVIHRLTGDGDKRKLIAPLWTSSKKKVLREINNAFVDRDIIQGEKL